MLFNSAIYILAFLPLVLLIFFLVQCAWSDRRLTLAFLLVASVVFYGWWKAEYVLLLCSSIAFNYGIGTLLAQLRVKPKLGNGLLAFGIAVNLATLALFKYWNFFGLTIATVGGFEWSTWNVMLPLAISFFTFQQIAYLVDVRRGWVVQPSFLTYASFVSFFPHLIAGPILHHSEIIAQFNSETFGRFRFNHFQAGVLIFIIGLMKKILIADNVAEIADLTFGRASRGDNIQFLEAWAGTLAFTEQIYFDFSGYSDMAIGSALMLGIVLPINFNSPYKAYSIIDFWHRWHITLSRFLREYLYFALGGNRLGPARRYINLLITMALGGLWHGAAWTFVIWGLAHGVMLSVNHAWRHLAERWSLKSGALFNGAAWIVTFLCVMLTWVLFRASDFGTAMTVYKGMSGVNGLAFDPSWHVMLERVDAWFNTQLPRAVEEGGFTRRHLLVLLVPLPVLFLMPNSQEILSYAHGMRGGDPSTVAGTAERSHHWQYPVTTGSVPGVRWRSPVWAGVLAGSGAFLVFKMMTRAVASPFIYFQF